MKPKSSLKRRAPMRRPPIKFIVFTEGKNTEPEYIEALQKLYDKTIIEIDAKKASGVPKTIAAKAIDFAKSAGLTKRGRRKLDSFEANDQVWVMFDRDEHVKVKESIDNCTANQIGVAYSNPCFELWLILHFGDFDKAVDHHKVQDELKALCSDYSTRGGKTAKCEKFIAKHLEAEKRAANMVKRRSDEGAELSAPWTTVFRFTEAVRTAAQSCEDQSIS